MESFELKVQLVAPPVGMMMIAYGGHHDSVSPETSICTATRKEDGHDTAVYTHSSSWRRDCRFALYPAPVGQSETLLCPKILRASRVQFLQARVISLDPSQRSVTVLDQQQQPHELEYDYLVYALGSMTDRHSVAGVSDYAYSLQASGPLSAAALRDRLPALEERSGQVVVCGGGATGIETAAQVASVYPQIKVSLVTHGPLGLSWDKSVAEAIRRRLVSLGVQIVEHSKVSAVHAHSVVLEQDRELACDLCIWTAGFVVQPLARQAGLAVNERDQILVDPFLRSVSHPEIYAIGDAASPVEEPGVQHVRMSANTAGIMGAQGADCLSAILTGKKPKPLSFAYLAQAIALGRHHGIFFLLTPEDRPRPPYITGWLGSLAREGALRFVVTAILLQRRLPGLFVWPGKGRYEQAQRQKQALEEFPELSGNLRFPMQGRSKRW
jgi:NADH dehydrogenase FAD-containing subunit